jgi:hypothetical protein
MKKLILAAMIVISSATAMGQTGGNKKVNVSFHAAFPEAANVTWSQKKAFVVISFTEFNQPVEAYYDYDGNKIAVSRNVRLNNLTMPALSAVQKKYFGYDFVGGVELDHAEDGHSYYVSLQKDSRRVILRVSLEGDVKVFKTMKVTDIHLPAFATAEDILK